MTSEAPWKSIAANAQSSLAAKIPDQWRLPRTLVSDSQSNVAKVSETCGLLSDLELDITSKDARLIVDKIRSGSWSSEQVVIAFCKRATIAHQLINCLTEICFDEAIQTAKELDQSFQETSQVKGPLHGLPISIKDHINVAGLISSQGYCSRAHYRPEEDAVLVRSLKDAGAIVFVKTTMPMTGMVLETISNLWGRTTNPFNRSLGSGGSSGGEGALIAMRGSPLGLGTDVGGSIRIPAAFNGLYGFKPSSRRLSYRGMMGNVKGAATIPAVVGPIAHSIRDLELTCRIATAAEPWYKDANVVNKLWSHPPAMPEKLTIGIMKFDRVVMPHPPVLHAFDEAVSKLKAAGHEVIEFEPYQHQRCWDLAYFLYYTTGAKEMKAFVNETGEPWPITADKLSNHPNLREVTVPELYKLHTERDQYKFEYLQHWNDTAKKTSSGRPVDMILTPVSPSAGFPHDFLPWWGYTSTYNLLDYPCVIIPVSIDSPISSPPLPDPYSDFYSTYTPINVRDRENHALWSQNPGLWKDMPIALQIVGRGGEDEKALAVAGVVDQVLNG